jgi:hypothetical protein
VLIPWGVAWGSRSGGEKIPPYRQQLAAECTELKEPKKKQKTTTILVKSPKKKNKNKKQRKSNRAKK